jgi:hypothetical protein
MIQNPRTHFVKKCGIYDEADGTYAFSNYDAAIALVNRADVDWFSAYAALTHGRKIKNL